MTDLVRYDAACRAVADAASVDEAKDLRDKSEAMRAYARQAKNKQLEVQAAEIRIRAERRIGELMAAQRDAGAMSGGGRPPEKTGSQTDPVSAPPTLAEVGIDKHLADRARKYAAIPEPEFNGIVSDWRGRVEAENERVTVNLMAAGSKVEDQAPVEAAEDAKERRDLCRLTADALIDEVIGLRADLIDAMEKARSLSAEVEDLKEKLREATAADLGAAVGRIQRRLDQAVFARDEAMKAAKREEFKRKQAEKRVAELESMGIQLS